MDGYQLHLAQAPDHTAVLYLFGSSEEFQAGRCAVSDEVYLVVLYRTALDRAPLAAEFIHWLQVVAHRHQGHAKMIRQVIDASELMI